MPAPDTAFVVCFLNRDFLYRRFIWKAFLTKEAARTCWAAHEHDYGVTYDEKLARGDVVEYEVPAREHAKIAKTGLVWAAVGGTKTDWTLISVSASRSGLVKRARETHPNCTDLKLFHHSTAGGVFLVDGYPLPTHYLQDQGALVVPPGVYG